MSNIGNVVIVVVVIGGAVYFYNALKNPLSSLTDTVSGLWNGGLTGQGGVSDNFKLGWGTGFLQPAGGSAEYPLRQWDLSPGHYTDRGQAIVDRWNAHTLEADEMRRVSDYENNTRDEGSRLLKINDKLTTGLYISAEDAAYYEAKYKPFQEELNNYEKWKQAFGETIRKLSFLDHIPQQGMKQWLDNLKSSTTGEAKQATLALMNSGYKPTAMDVKYIGQNSEELVHYQRLLDAASYINGGTVPQWLDSGSDPSNGQVPRDQSSEYTPITKLHSASRFIRT